MAKRVIAVFDFDGTLITKDSFLDLLIFYRGIPRFIFAILANIHYLLAYILRIIPGGKAKVRLYSFYFKNMPEQQFQKICEYYSLKRIPEILNPEIYAKFAWHKKQSHTTVIASASLENWISPWAAKAGFAKVIGTKPAFVTGSSGGKMLSGKLATPNCNHEEKLRRFLAEYPDRKNYILYVYGNINGDKELLKSADNQTVI